MNELELRQFNIQEADWVADGKILSNIRRIVFIVEQNVPQEEEWDGKDADSWHWLATDANDAPIGTARLLRDGQIGRMAVFSQYRKLGIGAALLEQAVEKARHLGMSNVFLNAQTHALGFYERCGFTAEGEEFEEAGIPHKRMIQTLAPPIDNIQRKSAVELSLSMAVKVFDTSESNWSRTSKFIRLIRRQVLVTELKLPKTLETDEVDNQAIHWVAENDDGHLIGAIRMSRDGEISRLVVLANYRRQGIGYSLLELAIGRARRYGLDSVRLTAVAELISYYQKAGFVSTGEAHVETGTNYDSNHHSTRQKMVLSIAPEDRQVATHKQLGESFTEDLTYQLGADKQRILLRSEEDFRNVIIEMTRQAQQSIRIYSPNLNHSLFDSPEMLDICSRLARRNKYTRIEMLIFDSHRIVKNGHALLNIARKLPSSINIKIVDPEMRQLNNEYVLVDGQGTIYRQDYEKYEGTACFRNVTECNRLDRQFTASWESGLLDANLRQLRI